MSIRGRGSGSDGQVAVKIIRDSGEDLGGTIEREARLVARLQHPNIVSVFDAGQQDGNHYLVAEYIEGSSLREVVGVQNPIGGDRGAKIGDDDRPEVGMRLYFILLLGLLRRVLRSRDDLLMENLVLRQQLDHLIVLNERHLLHVLHEYTVHYNAKRPHRTLVLELARRPRASTEAGRHGHGRQPPGARRPASRIRVGGRMTFCTPTGLLRTLAGPGSDDRTGRFRATGASLSSHPA